MLDAILSVPVIVKVFAALAVILIINSFCRHLLVSVAVGALVLALWSGHSAADMLSISWLRLSSRSNLFLMLIVFQVIWLSSQMSASGVMQDLVEAVRARVSQRTAMAVLPAVIGFLPMPGGALFSAPLVESCDADGRVAPGLKARTNHWFRHVWEYWWPLYPGVLLAMEIMRLEVWQFMLIGIPLSVSAIAAGYFFLLRRIGREEEGGQVQAAPGDAKSLLPLLLPILVVIACYALVRLGHAGAQHLWPAIGSMNRYGPMVVGLFCAMLVLQRTRPLGRASWQEIVFSRRALNLALIVAAVRVYGAFIEAELPSGEPLVAQMRGELAAWGIPLIAIVMILPLVSGLATGLSIGFVGASFPIVLNLLGQDPSPGMLMTTTVLAFGFGYMGMLLSPVHVCLILTSEHFDTQVLRNTVGMIKPAAVVLAWALTLHLLMRWILL